MASINWASFVAHAPVHYPEDFVMYNQPRPTYADAGVQTDPIRTIDDGSLSSASAGTAATPKAAPVKLHFKPKSIASLTPDSCFHVFEQIAYHADVPTLLKFRVMSRALNEVATPILKYRHLTLAVEENSNKKRKTSGRGPEGFILRITSNFTLFARGAKNPHACTIVKSLFSELEMSQTACKDKEWYREILAHCRVLDFNVSPLVGGFLPLFMKKNGAVLTDLFSNVKIVRTVETYSASRLFHVNHILTWTVTEPGYTRSPHINDMGMLPMFAVPPAPFSINGAAWGGAPLDFISRVDFPPAQFSPSRCSVAISTQGDLNLFKMLGDCSWPESVTFGNLATVDMVFFVSAHPNLPNNYYEKLCLCLETCHSAKTITVVGAERLPQKPDYTANAADFTGWCRVDYLLHQCHVTCRTAAEYETMVGEDEYGIITSWARRSEKVILA